MRVLVVGWASFLYGEATAGDVLSMETVARSLRSHGVGCDLAWSPRYRRDGVHLDEAGPGRYTHLVFVCGPAHGDQVRALHRDFRRCRRIAVGVSVIDERDPAVTGFHEVFPRDGGSREPRPDLAAGAPAGRVPVVGVVLAPAQREYGDRRRHDQVTEEVTAWLATKDCARVPLDTRLDTRDWRHCATPGQLESIIARLDLVVTMRLHGLVLALRNGVPPLAVDPVAHGAKVSAQASVWNWPAVLRVGGAPDCTGRLVDTERLAAWWDWCRTPEARRRAASAEPVAPPLLADLLSALELAAPRQAPDSP